MLTTQDVIVKERVKILNSASRRYFRKTVDIDFVTCDLLFVIYNVNSVLGSFVSRFVWNWPLTANLAR